MWSTTFLILTLLLAAVAASGWTDPYTQIFVWSAAGTLALFVVSIFVHRSHVKHEHEDLPRHSGPPHQDPGRTP